MADYPIFRGWGLFERAGRKLKQSITYPGIANEARRVELTAQEVQRRLERLNGWLFATDQLAESVAAERCQEGLDQPRFISQVLHAGDFKYCRLSLHAEGQRTFLAFEYFTDDA